MEATTSSTLHSDLPRSKIYVSDGSRDEKQDVDQKQQQRFKTSISDFHFLLILKCGELYTQEDLSDAQGRYQCYNCTRKIFGPIYLIPERFNPQTNEPTCSPIPHCDKACVYRSVQDRPNNGDLLTNLFLMYGHDIVCAPPRFLLFIPGGMTLQKYHEAIQQQMVYETMDPLVHAFIGPIMLSCTIQKDHQLLPSVVEYIDAIKATKKATIGPQKKSGTQEQVVVSLPTKNLLQTRLSEVFHPEPASFGRPGIAGNPHMT